MEEKARGVPPLRVLHVTCAAKATLPADESVSSCPDHLPPDYQQDEH
jgi:hypothetical protein